MPGQRPTHLKAMRPVQHSAVRAPEVDRLTCGPATADTKRRETVLSDRAPPAFIELVETEPGASLRRKTRQRPAPGGRSDPLLTEELVAQHFCQRYKDQLRFCHSTQSWFVWTGTVWKKDETCQAFNLARILARRLSAELPGDVRALTGRKGFVAGVETFARNDLALAVTAEFWDRDPYLLGTPSGTVDLRTGNLRPANLADGITKQTVVAPAADPQCPLWLRFLRDTTGGDDQLMRFLQQWCGYALTGITTEHALVFIFGPGGNGKSVFLNIVAGILNTYAVTAAMETFTVTKGDKHPTDIAMLLGARFVTANETERDDLGRGPHQTDDRGRSNHGSPHAQGLLHL